MQDEDHKEQRSDHNSRTMAALHRLAGSQRRPRMLSEGKSLRSPSETIPPGTLLPLLIHKLSDLSSSIGNGNLRSEFLNDHVQQCRVHQMSMVKKVAAKFAGDFA